MVIQMNNPLTGTQISAPPQNPENPELATAAKWSLQRQDATCSATEMELQNVTCHTKKKRI